MIKEDSSIVSNFIPCISFGTNTSSKINDDYILPIVNKFMTHKGASDYSMIDSWQTMCDLDFPKIPFSVFYKELLFDIHKDSTGKVIFKTKCAISFDKIFCSEFCEETNTFYQELLIGKTPLLYFVFIDFHHMMSSIRSY